MKKLLYILPFLLLPFMVAGQESNTEETVKKESANYKNQIDLGIEILAPSFSYTRKINENIRIGAGFGFGYSLAFGESQNLGIKDPGFRFKDGVVEIIHIGAILEFKLNRHFFYELKPQLTMLGDSEFQGQVVYGLKNGLFIKLNKIKLGLNVCVGKSESEKWLFYIQPLQLKIPIKHW